MTPRGRAGLRLAGGILTLAALYFVLQRLWGQRDALAEWEPTWLLIGALIVGGILQGLAGFLLSGGWARLLRWCTDREPDWRACHRLYGRTQLAKYIPGNTSVRLRIHKLQKTFLLSMSYAKNRVSPI